MKKILSVLFVILILTVAVSCGTVEKENSGSEKTAFTTEATASSNGIVLTSDKTVYSTDTEKLTVVWNNNSEEKIGFGQMFTLEKKDKTTWNEVEPETEVVFNLDCYTIEAGAIREHTYNLQVYGDLEVGEYRINTTYRISNDESGTEYPIYFEFTVE